MYDTELERPAMLKVLLGAINIMEMSAAVLLTVGNEV